MVVSNHYKPPFDGLFGEVVTEDIYHLRDLKHPPDVVFDLGANIGIFTRHARDLFPDALIVAVEPDAANCEEWEKDVGLDAKTVLLRAAIGSGQVWKASGAVNGAHECYPSVGLGFSSEGLDSMCDRVDVATTLPGLLAARYVQPGQRVFWKIDCEGGENAIVADTESRRVLSLAENIVVEMHFHSQDGAGVIEVRDATFQWISSLWPTHAIGIEHVMLYAEKRQ